MRSRTPRIATTVAFFALALASMAGCTTTVTGHGAADFQRFPAASSQASAPTGSPGASAPTTSGGASATASSSAAPGSDDPTPDPNDVLTCPTIVHSKASLKYDCLSPQMIRQTDEIWPLALGQEVAPNWMMNEGSGWWGPSAGQTLGTITAAMSKRMLDIDGYGPSPRVAVLSDQNTSINGHSGHILNVKYTLNSAFVAQRGLTVKSETAWIVAITTSANSVSVWYVSVPDVSDALAPKVPALIAGIRVI